MRRIGLGLTVLAAVLLAAAPSHAAVWYVNDTSTVGDSFTTAIGNDSNSGTNTSPFRTTNRALSFAAAGDTIYIDAGTYTDTVVINVDSISLVGVDSSPSGTVFSKSGSPCLDLIDAITATNRTGIFIANLRIQGWRDGIIFNNVDLSTIQDVTSESNCEYNIHLTFSDTNQICRCFLRGVTTNYGIALDTSHGNTLESSTVSNRVYSVYLVGSNDNILRFNKSLVIGQSQNDIPFHLRRSNRNTLLNNTADGRNGVGYAGFYIQDSSFYNTIDNCSATGFDFQGFAFVGRADSNVLTNCTAQQNSTFSGSPGSILVDQCINIALSGNVVLNATNSTGILIRNSFGCSIVGNVVSKCYQGYEINAGNAHYVASNVATNNIYAGYEFRNGTNQNRIVSNRSYNNGGPYQLGGFGIVSGTGNILIQNQSDSDLTYSMYINNIGNQTISKNNISTSPYSPDSGLWSGNLQSASLVRHWWGTTDSQAIRNRIQGPGADSIVYYPFRLGPIDTAQGADTVAPKAPDTVTATATSAASILIAWSPVTASEEAEAALNLAGYRIYRATSPAASLWTFRASAGPSTLQVNDSGLSGGQTWYYRVTAFDNAPYVNESFYSDSIASATTPVDTVGPSAFALVAPAQGTETTATSIRFEWTAATDDTSPPVTYTLRTSTSAAFTTFTDSAIGANTSAVRSITTPDTYYWRVIASDDAGNTTTAGDSSFRISPAAESVPPSIIFYRTTPDTLATRLDTTIVTGRIADSSLPPTVTVRRIGPVSSADSALSVAGDGTFSGLFSLEVSGESTTTFFALTATDLSGNTSRETIGITKVDTIVPTTVAGGVASATAVLADSAGATLSVRQETASSVALTLPSSGTSMDTLEVRIDFAAGWTGGMVVVRRPDTSILNDPSLEISLAGDTASILSKYLVEILVYDSAGMPVGSRTDPYALDTAARTGIRLIIHYNEADFGASEPNIRLRFYDEAAGVWRLLSDSPALGLLDLGLDMTADTIGYLLAHFTIFAPIPSGTAAAANLDNVVVFPNPFIPYDGNPQTGEPFSGTASATNATGIHIVNLTTPVTITIYDIRGRKVDEISNIPNQGMAIWDARTSSGREVASGTYIIVIRDGAGRTAVRKVAIIQ